MSSKLTGGPWSPEVTLPDAFIQAAKRVYQHDPQWIPEQEQTVRFMFSAANPYFQAGSVWLGTAGNALRLAGFFAPYQVIGGKKAAYFGYWETCDDLALNQAAFSEFESWARSQGAEVIYGPINFSTYGSYRVRIDRFDMQPFIGEPYNPSYYPELMDSLGYRVDQLYGSTDTGHPSSIVDSKLNDIKQFEQTTGQEYRIFTVSVDYWMSKLEQLYALSVEIFQANFAYTPISFTVFKQVCGADFIKKACQHSSVIAESLEGDIAGMMLNFPDYAPLVCQGADYGIAPSQANFAEHFDLLPRPRSLLLKTAGTAQAHRGKHLYNYLFHKSCQQALAHYDNLTGCLFHLDNPSRKTVSQFNEGLRRYALYAKEL